MRTNISFLVFILIELIDNVCTNEALQPNSELYSIEGKVYPPDNLISSGNLGNWQIQTRIMGNGGEFRGFLREDGNFVISNVPSGSYLIEAVHPDYAFEPVRVEINFKGKFRARKVNFVQTSKVIQVPYPLKMKPLAKFKYFQVREQWRATDFLFSPMVLMMVLPLLLIMILPKVMNDPEARRDMELLNNSMKYDMPEMSEVITSFFAGGEKPKPKSVKSSKKKVQ
ncbi:hypothetical protein RUM44_012461 [Polyplax serrata]|uniref:ER membrane protein complex subunit 7 beta-sandwich domain-containing protein n=1 Tax=Polyplax serrata TaxID=468196 RepID=A0ABR1BFE9_POLSC